MSGMTMIDAKRATPVRARRLWAALLGVGFIWGLAGPLSKLAVSTGNHPVGVTFWNTLIAALVLAAIGAARRERPPIDRRHIVFYLICGLLGTALPNSVSYTAYKFLPIGVNVMVLSLVPMATLLLALPLRLERLDPRRALGLALGVVAVALIALPTASLPSPEMAIWVSLPVVVAVSYAAENVYIAHAQPKGATAFQTFAGLTWGALALMTPMAFAFDAWFPIWALGPAEQAVLGVTGLHLIAYFGYVWLIGRAGPVFASQVGYVVTATGVLLGMAIYGERHSLWVWSALALMMIGLSLVRPRR